MVSEVQPANGETITRFLSVRQVASALGVHYSTIMRLIHTGDLPAMKVGKLWRISRNDLDRYLKLHKVNQF